LFPRADPCFLGFPRRGIHPAFRNIHLFPRLVRLSQSNAALSRGVCPRDGKPCVPQTQGNFANGTVHQRHQDHERFVRAPAAALINAAQAAEHYEITRYGSLVAWAKQPGRNDCAAILQKTLDEEKATDKKLTTIAESKVNLRAAS
jgi:hypothetical protein